MSLSLVAAFVAASGCSDDNKAKRAREGDGGDAARGGEAADAGSSALPGSAGLGGQATGPGSGNAGSGDTNVNGGAPNAAGAESSSGGVEGSAAGANGNGNAVVQACRYPNGGECDELAGTAIEASMFEATCLNNERLPLDSCPTQGATGICAYQDPGPNVQTFYYTADAQALADAEQDCIDHPGIWTTP